MRNFTSQELRDKWLNFYKDRGHVDIGAVSLVGDGTTGVMFNVAGMQPLMPYLLGQKHPKGTRLCNVQGCVRTVDIDSVGDTSHCTFFEMLGSWSLGDYFKEDRTKWSYELLTEVLGFDRERIAVTVFEGNKDVPRDDETAMFREKSGILKENIYYLPKEDNWWELERGPCGPDSEMFYITDKEPCGPNCNPSCNCGRFIEVGNDVFMQYERVSDNEYIPLSQKNVDTGWGLERLLVFLNNTGDVYLTDLFESVIRYLEKSLNVEYGVDAETTKSMRVIADHIRTAVMLIGDQNHVLPSNVGAGYILRRLLRRAIRHANKLGLNTTELIEIAKIYIEQVYNKSYPLLLENEEFILTEITKEMDKFNKALDQGLREFDKVINGIEKHKAFAMQKGEEVKSEIGGKAAFRLYDTFGFPLELTVEMASERGYSVDEAGFKAAFEEHQEKSKAVDKGQFKSGLEDNSENTIKYHTATHLLNAALKQVFGADCHQMGSNITAERLRFDFPCDHKLTPEEISKLETIVNDWIKQEIVVTKEEMPKEKAVEIGAEHQFIERYPDIVTVYSIGDVSKEICTGPHVENTNKLGLFKITKEESSSSGVRRIKAVLQ